MDLGQKLSGYFSKDWKQEGRKVSSTAGGSLAPDPASRRPRVPGAGLPRSCPRGLGRWPAVALRVPTTCQGVSFQDVRQHHESHEMAHAGSRV